MTATDNTDSIAIADSDIADIYDAVLVGAGAAGLEAALVLGRQRRRVLILDSSQYRNAHSTAAHMLLGQEGTAPALLRSRTLDSLSELPHVDYVADEARTAEHNPNRNVVIVHTAANRTIKARRLVIAGGQRDLCDHVEGLSPAFGRFAFHCPYCHGFEASGKDILVLAVPGVPTAKAVYQALYLKDRISSAVRLLAPTAVIDDNLIQLLADAQIDIIDGEVASIAGAADSVTVTTTQQAQLHCEAAFATPPTESGAKNLVESLGLSTRGSCIEVDNNGRTSCPAVFAAGDIAIQAHEQEALTFVSQAVAEGQRAAVWVDQDLFMASLGINPPSA